PQLQLFEFGVWGCLGLSGVDNPDNSDWSAAASSGGSAGSTARRRDQHMVRQADSALHPKKKRPGTNGRRGRPLDERTRNRRRPQGASQDSPQEIGPLTAGGANDGALQSSVHGSGRDTGFAQSPKAEVQPAEPKLSTARSDDLSIPEFLRREHPKPKPDATNRDGSLPAEQAQ